MTTETEIIESSDPLDETNDTPEEAKLKLATPTPDIPASLTRQLIDARSAVLGAERELADAQAMVKARKSELEVATANVMSIIDNMVQRTTPLPLFDGLLDGLGPSCSPASSPSTDDESWRAHPMNLLDLPPGIVDALADAELRTVGDLEQFSKQGNQLTDVMGIGHVRAEMIESALERFWESRAAQQDDDDGDADTKAI